MLSINMCVHVCEGAAFLMVKDLNKLQKLKGVVLTKVVMRVIFLDFLLELDIVIRLFILFTTNIFL